MRDAPLVSDMHPGSHCKQLSFTVDDEPWEDLLHCFPPAIAYIKGALADKGKLLVHCVAGVSRSPSVRLTPETFVAIASNVRSRLPPIANNMSCSLEGNSKKFLLPYSIFNLQSLHCTLAEPLKPSMALQSQRSPQF